MRNLLSAYLLRISPPPQVRLAIRGECGKGTSYFLLCRQGIWCWAVRDDKQLIVHLVE